MEFNIEKHIATLSGESGEGVTKELNIVSWNGREPVVDVRAWSSKRKPYRGITLNREEVKALKAALDKVGLEQID